MKHTHLWFIVIVLIVGAIWFFSVKETHVPIVETHISPSAKLSPETANDPEQMIEVAIPENARLVSPSFIVGKARGPWYFEASFPIELKDSSGAVIATAVAQAQGEWMTENWVPFVVTLTFPAQPTGSVGSLVFHNDNPSGELVNTMSLVVPVQF